MINLKLFDFAFAVHPMSQSYMCVIPLCRVRITSQESEYVSKNQLGRAPFCTNLNKSVNYCHGGFLTNLSSLLNFMALYDNH